MEKEDFLETRSVDSPASSQDGITTNMYKQGGRLEIMKKQDSLETRSVDSPASSQDGNTTNHHKGGGGLETMEKEHPLETSRVYSSASSQDGNTNSLQEGGGFTVVEKEDSLETGSVDSPASSQDGNISNCHKEGGGLEIMKQKDSLESSSVDSPASSQDGITTNQHKEGGGLDIMEKDEFLETSRVNSPASSQDGNTTNRHIDLGALKIMKKENSLETSSVDSTASSKDGYITNRHNEGGGLQIIGKEDSLETSSADFPASSQDGNTTNRHKGSGGLEIMEKEESLEASRVDSPASSQDGNTSNCQKDCGDLEITEKENSLETSSVDSPVSSQDGNISNHHREGGDLEIMEKKGSLETSIADSPGSSQDGYTASHHKEGGGLKIMEKESLDPTSVNSPASSQDEFTSHSSDADSENAEGTNKNEKIVESETREPVIDGTEIPGISVAITNFMRLKNAFSVSSVLRHLSMKGDDEKDIGEERMKHISDADSKEVSGSTKDDIFQEILPKTDESSGWNPLSFIGISLDSDPDNKAEQMEDTKKVVEPISMKGRILLYTKLGCLVCEEARSFLHLRRLRYVEINIDVYPSRKCELEKFSGSPAVPKVFFNEVLIGGLSELKELDESGKLKEKIEYVISEIPSLEAPLPPLSGEDDVSSSGSIDELALIVRNMKSHIVVKDRFYKMRRWTNTFMGSEAVDFLSEDQYLEREEAIQFGRKLARNLFLQHVLEENVFEDGNDLYRFLDDDPLISQCQNIPRGIIEVKPKPIADISSRLRFMCFVIFDAYTSKDGNHVDYRSIHGSEEFARYLRIVEELQRVDLHGMPREEKLAFFINLYNMMTIHAILVWGHPAGVLERNKLFGEFKYVIGGCTYSLSDVQNGILRGNQRTPYTLTKTFSGKDKRSMVALSHLEPLIHFALVCGTRSGPALRCYSSRDIDKELMEAAHQFLRSGGLTVDLNAKIASVNKIFKWFRSDFGKNENEVLKHAAMYLEPQESQTLLELLDETQLKVVYQPYDWGLNN